MALNEYITTASIILANDENVPGQHWEMEEKSPACACVCRRPSWCVSACAPISVYLKTVSWESPPARWHWKLPFAAFARQRWPPWGSGRTLVLLPSGLLAVASSAVGLKSGRERGEWQVGWRGGQKKEKGGWNSRRTRGCLLSHLCLLGPRLVLEQSGPCCPAASLPSYCDTALALRCSLYYHNAKGYAPSGA